MTISRLFSATRRVVLGRLPLVRWTTPSLPLVRWTPPSTSLLALVGDHVARPIFTVDPSFRSFHGAGSSSSAGSGSCTPQPKPGYVVDPYSIHLNNLPYEVDEQTMIATFQRFGPIQERGITVKLSKELPNTPGTAWGSVTFKNIESAQAAIKAGGVYMGEKRVFIHPEQRKAGSCTPQPKPGYVFDPYSIHLNNLPYGVDEQTMIATFQRFGPIQERGITVKLSKKIPNSVGTAWGSVTFKDIASAQAAIKTGGLCMDAKWVFIEPEQRPDGSVPAPTFTTDSTVNFEVVIAILFKDQGNPRFHSLWPCNLSPDNKLVHLQEDVTQDPVLDSQIKAFCLKNSEIAESFWRPLKDDIPPINMFMYAVKKHNLYKGQLLLTDYFQLCQSMSSFFIKDLPKFMEEFKKELGVMISTGRKLDGTPFKPDLDALDFFSRRLEDHYKKKIRVTVIDDGREVPRVELGFFHGKDRFLIDHPNHEAHAPILQNFYDFYKYMEY